MQIKFLIFVVLYIITLQSFANDCKVNLNENIKDKDINNSIYTLVVDDNLPPFYKGLDDVKDLFEILKDKKYIEGYAIASKLANQNNHLAQLILGELYYFGHGVNKSNTLAEKWWLKSAESNSPMAFYALGVFYDRIGENIKAGDYFLKSAELGNKNAMLLLSLAYFHGRNGMPQDENKFFAWASLAGESTLFDKTEITWPDPCQNIPIKLSLSHVLELMIGNERWYADKDRQEKIRNSYLSYDEYLFRNNNGDYYSHSEYNNVMGLSTQALISSSDILHINLGWQKMLKSLSSQPNAASSDEDSLEGMARDIENQNFYAIFSSDFNQNNKDKRFKSMSPDDIWIHLAPGDQILLSDKVTHHWTTVFKIDRDNGYIYILDLWPDEFFLMKDKNLEGIEAETITYKNNKTLIKVNKKDFSKVIIGFGGGRGDGGKSFPRSMSPFIN